MKKLFHGQEAVTVLRRARALWGCVTVALAFVILSIAGCSERSTDSATPPNTGGTQTYTLGTKLTFGQGGSGEAVKKSGWSSPEPGHTWSDKPTAVLSLHLAPSAVPLAFRARLNGQKKEPELPFQPVEVDANGVKIADWKVGDEADFTAQIPADAVKGGGDLMVEFKVPKASSPKQLGMGDDLRMLGIALHSVVIEKAE